MPAFAGMTGQGWCSDNTLFGQFIMRLDILKSLNAPRIFIK